MHRRALALTATLTASVLLTGCSHDENSSSSQAPETTATETIAESSADASSADSAQFDTGSYKTDPIQPWSETSDHDGPAVEMALIANNTLLPYEVDPDLTAGSRKELVWAPNKLAFDLTPSAVNRLKQLGSRFLRGVEYRGETSNASRSAANFVLRFEDEASAQEAADMMMDVWLTEGTFKFSDSDPDTPGTEEDVPGRPNARGLRSAEGDTLDVVEVHNEYLLWSEMMNAMPTSNPGARESPQAHNSPEETAWQGDYARKFAEKQIPILDTLPTKKTDAGYGMSDSWQPVDPDDILRFAVAGPKDESVKRIGVFAASDSPRAMAANYADTRTMLNAIDQAGVEAMAQNETNLFRAKNPEAAQLLLATRRSINADQEIEKWDHPQGVPGAECVTSYNSVVGKYHSCYLAYENYYAEATGYEPSTADVGGANAADVKNQVQQAIAAQYLILQQAPVKK